MSKSVNHDKRKKNERTEIQDYESQNGYQGWAGLSF